MATADDKEAAFVIYKSRYLDSAAVGIGTMTVVFFPMQHLLESCWRHFDLVCATEIVPLHCKASCQSLAQFAIRSQMKQTQVALKSAEGEMKSPFNADFCYSNNSHLCDHITPYVSICIHMLYFPRSPTEVPVKQKKHKFPAAGGANI